MTAIARLRAVMGLDTREFEAGTSRAGGSAGRLASQVKAVGGALAAAFSVRSVIQWGKSFVQWASEISIGARNLGMLTSEMMALREIGAQTGNTMEDIRKWTERLNRAVNGAATGVKELDPVFERLGFTLEGLIKMDAAERLLAVGKAAAASANPMRDFSDAFGAEDSVKMAAFFQTATGGFSEVSAAAGGAIDQVEELDSAMARFSHKQKERTAYISAFYREVHSAMREAGSSNLEATLAAATRTAAGFLSFGLIGTEGPSQSARERDQRMREEAAERQKATQEQLLKALEQTDIDAAKRVRGEIQKLDDARLEGAEKMKREYEITMEAIAAAAEKATPRHRAALEEMSEAVTRHHERDLREFRDTERQKAAEERNRQVATLQSERDRLEERHASIAHSVRGQGIAASTMARMGGMSGRERGGLQVADRQLKVAQEQARIMEQIREVAQRIADVQSIGPEGSAD